MKTNLLKFLSPRMALTAVVTASLVLAACGKPIPVESMADARYAIQKAESVNAAKYSKESLEKAQQKLIESHTFASEKKMQDAQTAADEAKRLAEVAFTDSLPLLSEDTADEAKALIKEAETLNAEEFAPTELSQARSLYEEGKAAEDKGDYLTAYQKYEQAREEARKARDISDAKVEYMKRDADEIQQMVRQSERYGAKSNLANQYNEAAKEVATAQTQIDNRQLKDASATLVSARAKAQALLDQSQKAWASDRYVQAENEVSGAESSVASLKSKIQKDSQFKNLYEKSATAKSAMKNTENTLAAAQQAKENASNNLRADQYTESYNQSSEAIRLSKIVNDQSTQVEGIVEGSKAQPEIVDVIVDGGQTPPEEEPVVEEQPKKEGDWKTYTVRLIPEKRDCLWRIAGYDFIYNNPRLWSRIYKANKNQIANPDLIYPGQILNIPPKEGEFQEAPAPAEKEEKTSSTNSGGVIGGGR